MREAGKGDHTHPFPCITEVRRIIPNSVVGGGNGGEKKKALMVTIP